MSIRGTLFILITVVVFFFTFKKPKIGMFYFICLLFLRDGYLMENIPEVYINWHLPLITGWVVLISWFANNLHNGTRIRKSFELILMMLLGLVIFVSRRNAYIPENTLNVFNEYLRMAILAFLIVNIIQTERDLKQISLLLVFLMAFLVIYSYHRYKTEGFYIAVPSLVYVDRNFFAESIVAIFPLAFMFYEESANKVKKFVFLGIAAFMAAVVILTDSRGGMLAFILVLFFLFLNSKKKINMLIMTAVILALFLPHIGEQWRNRMSTIKTYKEDSSAMVRIATYGAGLNMLKDHPVIGVGAGNFNPLAAYYYPPELSEFADPNMSIHNIFLQIFSETGFTGGGIFVLIILSCLFGLYRLKRKNGLILSEKRIDLAIPNALGVSLLGFCGAGFFLPGAYYSYIYIIFALIIASKRISYELLAEAKK